MSNLQTLKNVPENTAIGDVQQIGTFLSQSDINHLRRLLAWVRTEIPPTPDDVVSIVKAIAPILNPEEHAQKMVEWHREATSVPQYLRAASKALDKTLRAIDSAGKAGDKD